MKKEVNPFLLIVVIGIFLIGSVNAACTDSDGGQNPYIKGTITGDGNTQTDSCSSGKLTERYCLYDAAQNNYRFAFVSLSCSYGNCVDGACPQIACASSGCSAWGACRTSDSKKSCIAPVACGAECSSCSVPADVSCTCAEMNTCTDQSMFKLYQNTNSHVSVWNTSTYPISINYSDVFIGKTYSGLNPHECTVGNTNAIFWLNSINNSHVSATQVPGSYDVPVCYGDLSCSTSTSACISTDYKSVVRLYQNTNSHVSNLSDNNYPIYVCCKSPSASSVILSNLVWRNINGDIVNKVEKDDSVLLYFGNEGISTNYSVNNTVSGVRVSSGDTTDGFVFWQASSVGNYTFSTSNNNGVSWNLSSSLNVSGANDKAPNPVIIISPKNREKYMVGSPIQFSQITKDEDDLLNLRWLFGNGSEEIFPEYSFFEKTRNNNLGDIQTGYYVPGVYSISLFADEENRNLGVINYTNVIVLQEGINVVPLISTPAPGVIYSDVVVYNASETFVVNCSKGIISNLAFPTADEKLNCSYLHAPLSYRGSNLPTSPIRYNLTFNWTLDDGRNIIKDWNAKDYYNAVEFLYRYEEVGEHTTKLSVSYKTW